MKLICSTDRDWSDLKKTLQHKTDPASVSVLRNLDEYHSRTVGSANGLLLTVHDSIAHRAIIAAAGISFGCSVIKVHFHHVCDVEAVSCLEQAMLALFRGTHERGKNFHYGHVLIYCPAGEQFSSQHNYFRDNSKITTEDFYPSGDKGVCFSLSRDIFQKYYT